jgi:hypothetical protein
MYIGNWLSLSFYINFGGFMESQIELWEENYQLTQECKALCLLASATCFVVAVLAELVFNPSSNKSLSGIIIQNYGLIGMITFAVLTLACCLAYLQEGEKDLTNLSEDEIKVHQVSLHKVRGVIILLLLLFGLCNFLTPSSDIADWAKGSLASSILVALGFGCLSLALLCQNMAKTIKTKYLN